jgi:ERF superfamily
MTDTPKDTRAKYELVEASGASPLSLIARMIDSGKLTAESVSVVERLVALQEHMLEKAAEQAFAQSFAALQAELGSFNATKVVPDKEGFKKYTYLPYEEIMARVTPLLQAHGFSVSFSTDFADARIVQTCTLQHIAGHHRDYKAFVRAGAGPHGATETQADGAAMTYAKRYSLCNALNIVVEHDTDARNEGTAITPEQAQVLREMVKDTKSDEAAFLKYAGAKTYEEIGSARYSNLFKLLQKKARP